MKCKLTFPNYDHSILGIPNSFLNYYGAKSYHNTLTILDNKLKNNYKNVIMIILDGMGVDMMQHNLSCFSFLRRHIKSKLTSVFPSTTVAATAAYYSGLSPIEHGRLGWAPYFKDLDRVVEIFPNTDFYTGELLQEKVMDRMPYTHICDKIGQANQNVRTTIILPSRLDPNGPADFGAFCTKVKQQTLQEGSQFILAYWADPDHTSHKYGPYSENVKEVLKDLNARVKNLCADLKDSLVVISADHGHIENEDVFLNEYPDLMDCLALPLSLDMRTQAVFLKPDKEKEFVSLFNKYLAKDFLLMKTEDALKMNLFGSGTPHPLARGFLGDYLIMSKNKKSLVQRFPNDPYVIMKGAHSSLTNKEMLVPLILIEKK